MSALSRGVVSSCARTPRTWRWAGCRGDAADAFAVADEHRAVAKVDARPWTAAGDVRCGNRETGSGGDRVQPAHARSRGAFAGTIEPRSVTVAVAGKLACRS